MVHMFEKKVPPDQVLILFFRVHMQRFRVQGFVTCHNSNCGQQQRVKFP